MNQCIRNFLLRIDVATFYGGLLSQLPGTAAPFQLMRIITLPAFQ